MLRITIPAPTVISGKEYEFRHYLDDVILPLPFWRSKEGVVLADELQELIDGDKPEADITVALHEALCLQMALNERGLGSLNPQLARAAIRNARAVYEAKKVKPVPKAPVEEAAPPQKANEAS